MCVCVVVPVVLSSRNVMEVSVRKEDELEGLWNI